MKAANPLAFPFTPHPGSQWGEADLGMTLRDYFAAAAMASLVGRTAGMESITDCLIAGAAYDLADAMLAEREKRIGS